MAALLDGTLLCELVNGISPGVVPRVNRTKVVMLHNENITFFLKAARRLGGDGLAEKARRPTEPPTA